MTPVLDAEGRPPRVVIVGQNASMRMGGEASVTYFFFKRLRARGVEAWLVTHDRCREELLRLLPEEAARMTFIPESPLDVRLWKLGMRLPTKIDEQTVGSLRKILTGARLRRAVLEVIRREGAEVVHEPTPVSPLAPSSMYRLGVPVVLGPLSGAMDYPPAFQYMQGRAARWVERYGRSVAPLINRLAPGKLEADVLTVANEPTRRTLPKPYRGRVLEDISEVMVDVDTWGGLEREPRHDGLVRFVYLGRLVDWKGVDLLIAGFKQVADRRPEARLEILGDGPDLPALKAQAESLGIADRVEFGGWVTAEQGARRFRSADVFVLPSLRECGGIVLLEAMAAGLPVVTTRWGGPATHVTDETGIRVDPDTRESFVDGLARAMIRLAESPELRESMGRAGRARVTDTAYNWERKIDLFLDIYRDAVARSPGVARAADALGSPR